jgi:STE24 endopeptidase
MFYIFALFSIFINNASLYTSFGFHNQHPIIIGFILFSDALAPMDAVVKLLMNILSRKFEFEADKFALDLGYKNELAKSLIKLQVQNLSTMDADPIYASYHYSHPILAERLAALGWKSSKSAGAGKGVENGKVIELDEKSVDAEVVKASGRSEL